MKGRANYRVLELQFSLKYEWTRVARRDVQRISSAIKRQTEMGKHAGNSVSFLIVTNESVDELMDRIRPTLDMITAVTNDWCETASRDVRARHGLMDPYESRCAALWAEADAKNGKKRVAGSRPRNARVKNGIEEVHLNQVIKTGFHGPRRAKARGGTSNQ